MTTPPGTARPADSPSPAGGNGSAPQPLYHSTEEWVTRQFLPVFRRPLGGEYRWCRQWWRHAEAITRLTALWHSWEALRLQPGTGMAIWLRDHLDHQLPVLLGRTGRLRPLQLAAPQICAAKQIKAAYTSRTGHRTAVSLARDCPARSRRINGGPSRASDAIGCAGHRPG